MAYVTGHLEVAGHRGNPVPNTFLRQRGETAHLAVVLPGAGYTCQMPLLYYPTRLLLGAGADVLWVEYAYLGQAAFRALPDDEQERRFFADVEAALRTGGAQRSYARLTLVGKSLGTLAMGHLLGARAAGAAGGRADAVWLTPLLRNERLRRQIGEHRPPSCIVIGTADPHYDPALLDEVRVATGGAAVVVNGADHSLEVAGDVRRSLQALERTVRAVQTLVGAAP